MLGLIKYEAEQLLKKFGYNELPSAKPKNMMRIALEVIKEPMFFIAIGMCKHLPFGWRPYRRRHHVFFYCTYYFYCI